MTLRIDPKFSEHLFRPVYEVNSALSWCAGAIATQLIAQKLGVSLSYATPTYLAAAMLSFSGYNAIKAAPLLKKQMKLTTNKKIYMDVKELRKKNLLERRLKGTLKKDPRETYIGKGFPWGSEHAQRAYQVLDMDSTLSDVKVPFFLKPFIKIQSKETEELGGMPWIHGMGDSKDTSTIEDTWYGHSFITGNVGTGKTTLLKLMSLNALHMGNVLLILDPKNDAEWKESIKSEMEFLGVGDHFYHIHPSKQSTSARIPLLKHFTRVTEIADRVAPLMSSGGSNKAFEDFAYGIIFHTANALHYLGEPIRLTSIQKVIASDRKGLATKVIKKYYQEEFGDGWYEKFHRQFEDIHPSDLLISMATYYNLNLAHTQPNKVVEGMIEFGLHDEGHYSKMVVSLRPVLTALTAAPLDDLLSPIDNLNDTDERPIVDLRAVMEKGGCIYISLDSLTDAKSAGFISRLILAELAAVAGERYNNQDRNPRRVTIANDEVHASIENNDALLNMLAQGRAALMQMILASQTISDIESKTDKATANRFLGLCNNFISMRTTDPITQEYVAQQFMKSSIAQAQVQVSSGTDSTSSIMSFSHSQGEKIMKQREESFPSQLLGQLPKLEYVARLADGKKLKMKLPIIINGDA